MPKEVLGHSAFSISEFLEMPNEPQPYLWENLIYKCGKTVVVAKPKVGKSWLSLKAGHSISLGRPLLDLNVVPASVLFIEFDRRFLNNAIKDITLGQKSDNMHILPAPPTPLNSKEGYNFLLASVHEFAPKDGSGLLVIIDHKSACFGGKENEDATNRQWVKTLDDVERLFRDQISYLVICQAPKDWRGDIVDLPIGSRILAAWADTVISLKPHSKEARSLEMVSNYGELDLITYTKDFLVVREETAAKTKFDMAVVIVEERWDEFQPNRICEKVEEIASVIGCGYSTVWDAYRTVRNEKRLQAVVDKAADQQRYLDNQSK